MNEHVLVTGIGKNNKAGKILLTCGIGTLIFANFVFLLNYSYADKLMREASGYYRHDNLIERFNHYFIIGKYGPIFIIATILIVIGLVLYFTPNAYTFCISEKRLYGNNETGNEFSLDLKGISDITVTVYNDLLISYGSKTITLPAVKNAKEIRAAFYSVKALEANRQKNLQQLLQEGAITQTDYAKALNNR